jgi:GAF domain-containing protein
MTDWGGLAAREQERYRDGEARVPLADWLRDRLEREALRAVATAPLRVGGTVRGALGLLDSAGRTFDDESQRRLASFADDAAAELERTLGGAA